MGTLSCYHVFSRLYSLSKQVTQVNPYLSQFENWKNLFEQIENSTVYQINDENLKWLKEKNINFFIKQQIK